MARPSRYVVKAASGAYFSGFEVIESRPVTLNGVFVGTENYCEARFKANDTSQAVKFDTEADAVLQITNLQPNHGGAEAFAGCVAEPTDD
jgi:hypothetical protein